MSGERIYVTNPKFSQRTWYSDSLLSRDINTISKLASFAWSALYVFTNCGVNARHGGHLPQLGRQRSRDLSYGAKHPL
jgi:hypothetical protein